MYQLQKTLFDKLNSFNIPYSVDRKFFKNMALFNFGSICVQKEKILDTEISTCIGKHVPMSLSISSKLIKQPIFLSNSNLRALIESLVDALEWLARQSKAQMKLKFSEFETSVKEKLNRNFPLLINAAVTRNQYWNLKRSVSKKKKKKMKKSKMCRHSSFKHK